MPPSIWTRCGARANLRRFGGRAWRVVEAQHVVSTRKLVDSADEQRLLEDLIERAKPALPDDPEFRDLHYLLFTPFRHPPLGHGSRFGARTERGLWYGSTRLATALAEAAYYRLVFLEGTRAAIEPVAVDLSVFRVPWRTSRGVDLCREPFDRFRRTIASPVDHTATRALGRDMRADGVEAFRYPSARDPRGGTNVGLFTPRAFGARRPETPETWHCVATRARVEYDRRDFFRSETVAFPRESFLVDGSLPIPSL